MERKYKVLVAEDEPLILAGLKLFVEEWGYASEICEAYNGKAALENCLSFVPDIIVSDIRMPGMDGITMLQEIRKAGLKTKIIYYSGYAEFDYAREAVRLGAFDYLLKPILQDKLYEALNGAASEIDEEEKKDLASDKQKEQMETICEFLWSGSNITFEEFENDMSMDFPKTRFQLLILKSAEIEQDLKSISGQLYGSYEDIYYCRITLGSSKMLFVLNLDQLLPKDDILSAAEQICGIRLQGGISRPAGKMSKVAALMEEAEAAFATEELIDDERIVLYESINENVSFYKKRIVDGISDNDTEKVRGVLEHLWGMIQKEELMLTQIMDIYNEAVTLLTEKNTYYEQYEKTDMNEIRELIHTKAEFYQFFMRLFQEENVEFSNTEMAVDQVILEIEQNYQTELTLSSLCEKYHISISYLSTMIKKKTEHTFTEYLTNLRMEHAKKLLAEGNISVSEVTELVGYNDYFYFTKLFKKYVGVTPSKYRKLEENSYRLHG